MVSFARAQMGPERCAQQMHGLKSRGEGGALLTALVTVFVDAFQVLLGLRAPFAAGSIQRVAGGFWIAVGQIAAVRPGRPAHVCGCAQP